MPEKVAEKLDLIAVHLYPEKGKFDEAANRMKGFSTGKPVIVEETFPLKCSPEELIAFIKSSEGDAQGWISFYWGNPPDQLRSSKKLGDALLLNWLEMFQKRANTLTK